MSEQNEKQEYERRLQRRLKILIEKFNEGKIFIHQGLRVIDSLKAVRFAKDGSIDLNTVDVLVVRS